jgi:hypothetical protein
MPVRDNLRIAVAVTTSFYGLDGYAAGASTDAKSIDIAITRGRR